MSYDAWKLATPPEYNEQGEPMSDIALPVEQSRAPGTIGASQAAAALGLDPYKPPIVLWRELAGLPVDDTRPAFVREAADWGTALEPIIRGKYALAAPAFVVVPEESYIMDGWLRCTPDGLVYSTGRLGQTSSESESGRDDAPAGLLQVKTASAYKRDEWQDWIPTAYEIQVRVEMAVASSRFGVSIPWCDVTCLVGGQQLRGPFRVTRELDLERNIVSDLRRFWESVQSGTEPPIDGSAAWRSYASEKMRPSKVAIPATADIEQEIAAWMAARRARKELEAKENAIKTGLMLKLSAAGATKIESSRGPVTAYKTGGRTDWKGYAMSLGGLNSPPAQFKKPNTTWALRAPGDDDDE